jgi:hypothetical protein
MPCSWQISLLYTAIFAAVHFASGQKMAGDNADRSWCRGLINNSIRRRHWSIFDPAADDQQGLQVHGRVSSTCSHIVDTAPVHCIRIISIHQCL